MSKKNINKFGLAILAGGCAVALIGGLLLTKQTIKRNEEAAELSEAVISTEEGEEDENTPSTIYDDIEASPDSAKEIVASILEEHADDLASKGISLEAATEAEVQETSTGNYIIIVGDNYIFINSIDDLFYIDDVSNYFGMDDEGDAVDELYRNVYDVLYHNPDVLYAANVTLEDLWDEVCDGDYGIQNTGNEGVYTIKYNETVISVDVVNNLAKVAN